MNINNKATKQVLVDATAAQTIEEVPTKLSEIHGTIECNAQLVAPTGYVRSGAVRTTTGTTTLLSNTLTANKDFYITGLQVSLDCDAACDLTEMVVSVTTDDGYSSNLFRINKRVSVALAVHQYIAFPRPIKVKRNTGSGWTTTFGVGDCTSGCTLYGFYIEP